MLQRPGAVGGTCVCPVRARNTLTRGSAHLPHAHLGRARPHKADELRVGLGQPPLSPHQLSQQQPQTHTHRHTLLDRLSYHTHYLIHTQGHMDPPSYTLTRSHTPRTLPHINVLPPTLTVHHAPPTVTHTRSHPSSSHHPFHTCPVIHASSKHILLTSLCIIIHKHTIY